MKRRLSATSCVSICSIPPYVSSIFSLTTVISMGIPALLKTVSTPCSVLKSLLLANVFHVFLAVTLMLFTPLPFGVSIGPLKSKPRASIVTLASGVIPLLKPLSNTHLPISTKSYSSGTLLALKIFNTASIISGPIPSPFATAIFISNFYRAKLSPAVLFKR